MTIVGATKNSVGKYLGPSIEVGIDMKLYWTVPLRVYLRACVSRTWLGGKLSYNRYSIGTIRGRHHSDV